MESWGHYGRRIRPPIRSSFASSSSRRGTCAPSRRYRSQRHLYSIVSDPDNFALIDLQSLFGYCFRVGARPPPTTPGCAGSSWNPWRTCCWRSATSCRCTPRAWRETDGASCSAAVRSGQEHAVVRLRPRRLDLRRGRLHLAAAGCGGPHGHRQAAPGSLPGGRAATCFPELGGLRRRARVPTASSRWKFRSRRFRKSAPLRDAPSAAWSFSTGADGRGAGGSLAAR